MTKQIFQLFATLGLAAVLSACGADEAQDTQTTSQAQPEQTQPAVTESQQAQPAMTSTEPQTETQAATEEEAPVAEEATPAETSTPVAQTLEQPAQPTAEPSSEPKA